MHVALINLAQPPEARDADEVLAGVFILVGWAEALAAAGAQVTVIQGCGHDTGFDRAGVRYELVAGPFEPFLHPWRVSRPALDRLAACAPDVVHVNSLLHARQLHHARRRLPGAAFIVQHHAERPARRGLHRRLQRRWLRSADALVWNGLEMAAPWRAAGVLPADTPDHAVAEGSVRLAPAADRRALRRALGIDAEPLILWLGNLDANKDPLTVLRGLEPVLEARPLGRAILCFRHGGIEPAVRRLIASSPTLSRAVELRGHVPYAALEPLIQAADLLVQGSHREGSSFAVIEAFACGLVPVVTDIPSIRFLVAGSEGGDSACAFLFPPGDAGGFGRALEAALDGDLAGRQRAARRHFEQHLAYPVLARQMLAVYRQTVARRAAAGSP